MSNAHPTGHDASHAEQATVDSLLSDIRRADIPIHHVDVLIAATRLRARSLLWEAPGIIPNPFQHPVALPGNIDVTVPSNHGLGQYNGIVYVHPVQGTRGPFYVITHGRLVGVIANWLAAAPHVHRIEGAIFIKVRLMATATQLLMTAIDDDAVDYIA
ncbi:hypothetical protein J3R83DRAFT_5709 [Lanmaoa asiatica]|nr:hypothetical protein J3R83DRAFT_5709 [Lanmaoa asiatica]